MDSLLEIVSVGEPLISAVVGIITLVAAIWGVFRFFIAPALRRRVTQQTSIAYGIWSTLINRGVPYRADIADQISGRTLNACLIIASVIALILTLLGLMERSTPISLANLSVFILAVAAYALHAAGYANTARWLLVSGGMGFWSISITMMGPGVGLEYSLSAVLLLPILVFEDTQTTQRNVSCVMILLSLPLCLWLRPSLSEYLPIDEIALPEHYYYVNVIVVSTLVFTVLFLFNRSADASFSVLEDQQEKSEELVHGLLPAYVADKVKSQSSSVANWHSEASVLFATVTGFETLYKKLSAVQLLELLREIFGEFDSLLGSHEVEKINTLGTNYIAASGLDPDKRASTEALARVALEMRRIVRRVSENTDHPFGLRIGISTGEVVSGVIGEKRPSFDIWGDTVELARAIRSEASNGLIVVSESTHWQLKKRFNFERSEELQGAYLLVDEC